MRECERLSVITHLLAAAFVAVCLRISGVLPLVMAGIALAIPAIVTLTKTRYPAVMFRAIGAGIGWAAIGILLWLRPEGYWIMAVVALLFMLASASSAADAAQLYRDMGSSQRRRDMLIFSVPFLGLVTWVNRSIGRSTDASTPPASTSAGE